MPKAIIVGAGINGLCAAWGLVRKGWQVEILEQEELPNHKAASWDFHRLIRPHYAQMPGYSARIPAAFEAWNELWRDLGKTHYVERGMLALSRSEGDWTDKALASFKEAGMPYSVVSAEDISRDYPVFETEGVRYGLFTPRAGALLADRIVTGLLNWLRTRGVEIKTGAQVTRVDSLRGEAIYAGGSSQGDIVIGAAGVGLPELQRERFREYYCRRIVVVYLTPPDHLKKFWATAPCWVDLGGEDDLWGMPPMEGIPLKAGYGLLSRPGDPLTERKATVEDIAAVRRAYHGRIRDIVEFDFHSAIATFDLAVHDERFRLMREGKFWTLAAGSGHGFKFGALTGLDVAEAVEPGAFDAVAERMAGYFPGP